MKKSFTLIPVVSENKYIKTFDEDFIYDGSDKQKLLTAMMKRQWEYPQARILALPEDSYRRVPLEIVNGELKETDITLAEITTLRNTSDSNRERFDKTEDDICERQQYEEDPWSVRLTTPNIVVEKISYVFDNQFARSLAITLSKENPTEKVLVTCSSRTRVIYSNGVVSKDFSEIPYMEDDSDHFEFFKERWSSFKV